MTSKDDFYLTLPSNGALSMREYPNNRNNSWKITLPRPLNLVGEWEVGLANVSYPSESQLRNYLNGLKDDKILLRTGRIVWNTANSVWNSIKQDVVYGDIKHYNLLSLYDVFEAIFKEEYLKVLKKLDKADIFQTSNSHGQFETYPGDDCFSCSLNVDRSKIAGVPRLKRIDDIFTTFDRDFLLKFNFVKEVTISRPTRSSSQENTRTQLKPTSNIRVEFADDSEGWTSHRDTRFDYEWYWGLQAYNKDSDMKGVRVRYGVNVTFLNLKDLSHTKSSRPRTLFIHSSLCEPQTLGEDTRELLSQVSYQPTLKGGSTYEPYNIMYRGLRSNDIETVEIHIREEDEDEFAKFASGATTVTLHLRRRQR